jgi:serine/threonine-protein kinase
VPNRQRIGPVPPSTPKELDPIRSARRALPRDLLEDAPRRLSILALVGGALWAIGIATNHLLAVHEPGYPAGPGRHIPDVISGASVLLSLALSVYARNSNRDPQFILDLGLAYLVITALALGNLFHWAPMPSHSPITPTISWIGVCVLMGAAFMPSTPGRTLIAGLFAVSMNPLGMLIARARGMWDFGPASNVLLMHFPDYLLVGVAVVMSVRITRLGQQVARARDLGSYHLGDLIGKGGMGEVYEATHRMLARPAAIKLIRPEMLGEPGAEAAKIAIARFRREAETAASLRSPHTVELYDFGVAEDQTLYFVMELLDGMDLETLVRKKGPMPVSRAIYILRQVCESLEEAHVRGLVHRDIKPANIHVGRLGLRHDFVKVLDFGLVKSAAGKSDEHSLATAVGMTPGTPAYMAPEMALGDAVDGRADLYALGCVGYYLVTGTLVFEATSGIQMMARHLHDQPDAPSRRSELLVPPAFDQLVLACLSKKPEDRPSSAAALDRALAAIDAGKPWDEEQAMRWWQLNLPGPSLTPGRAHLPSASGSPEPSSS